MSEADQDQQVLLGQEGLSVQQDNLDQVVRKAYLALKVKEDQLVHLDHQDCLGNVGHEVLLVPLGQQDNLDLRARGETEDNQDSLEKMVFLVNICISRIGLY